MIDAVQKKNDLDLVVVENVVGNSDYEHEKEQKAVEEKEREIEKGEERNPVLYNEEDWWKKKEQKELRIQMQIDKAVDKQEY